MSNRGINRGMLCAALAATSWLGALPAQPQPSTGSALTRAKMAVARGDTSLAQKILATAASEAGAADRERLTAELAKLQRRADGADEAPQDPKRAAGDPVQRLIHKLDEGTTRNEQVKLAYQELSALGRLVDDGLLRALPDLGPFGLSNTLGLLGGSEHPQLLAALEKLLDRGDAMTVNALSQQCASLQSKIARPLARRLGGEQYPNSVRLHALEAMLRHGAEAAQVRSVAAALVADADLRNGLLQLGMKTQRSTGKEILRLLAEGDDEPSWMARQKLLLQRDDLQEDEALKNIGSFPESHRVHVANELAQRHPEWIRVAAISVGRGAHNYTTRLLEEVEWWRSPDVAMPALLSDPEYAFKDSTARNAIEGIVQTGWVVPDTVMPALLRAAAESRRWDVFLRCLGDDDEDRALAAWRQIDPSSRSGLFHATCASSRPWHDLMLTHLEAIETDNSLLRTSFDANWSGLSAANERRLVAIVKAAVERDGARTNNSRVQVQSATTSGMAWQSQLVQAISSGRDLPVALLEPLARAGDNHAWSVLAELAPARALELAGSWDRPRIRACGAGIVRIANQIGDARHVGLVLTAVSGYRYQGRSKIQKSVGEEACQFLVEHATGDPRAIALGTRTQLGSGKAGDWFTTTAGIVTEHLSIDDLDELRAMLPDLHSEVAGRLTRRLQAQLTVEQAPALTASLPSMLDRALADERRDLHEALGTYGIDRSCEFVLEALAKLGDDGAAASAKRVLQADGASVALQTAAAEYLLATAGDQLPAITAELLAHRSRDVVAAAFRSPALADSEQLQDQAIASIVRIGKNVHRSYRLFATLGDEAGLRVATALIEHDAFVSFPHDVCDSVLACIGDRKQAALVDLLARGRRHPSPFVRKAVAEQLGRTFAKEAAPVLIEMLRDDSNDVRQMANEALEQISNYLDAREKWQGRIK